MRTIRELELLDLTTLTNEDLTTLRRDLQISLTLTPSQDLASDGRKFRDIIRKQLSRVNETLLNGKGKNAKNKLRFWF